MLTSTEHGPRPVIDSRNGLFNSLHRDHYGQILGYCRKFLPNEDAEDVYAEVLCRACSELNTLRDKSAIMAWIFRIAHNLCIDKLRADKVKRTVELPVDLPAQADENITLRLTVHAAVSMLPDRLREAVILSDLEGLSLMEAAAVLSISEAAYKNRLFRARRNLRRLLIDMGVEQRSGHSSYYY